MLPRKTPETNQMNLMFCDSKPMILPDDKQRELTIALADLLLNAAAEPSESDAGVPHRPLTPAEAHDVLEPILDALAYVHGQGFVHGHMKPANFMHVEDQLKISSDGLCRIDESRGRRESRAPMTHPRLRVVRSRRPRTFGRLA